MTMHSVRFRGHLLDIAITTAATSISPTLSGGGQAGIADSSVTVMLLPAGSADRLSIVVGGTSAQPLVAGVAVGPLLAAATIFIRGGNSSS